MPERESRTGGQHGCCAEIEKRQESEERSESRIQEGGKEEPQIRSQAQGREGTAAGQEGRPQGQARGAQEGGQEARQGRGSGEVSDIAAAASASGRAAATGPAASGAAARGRHSARSATGSEPGNFSRVAGFIPDAGGLPSLLLATEAARRRRSWLGLGRQELVRPGRPGRPPPRRGLPGRVAAEPRSRRARESRSARAFRPLLRPSNSAGRLRASPSRATPGPRYGEVLTPAALAFLAGLHRAFDATRKRLLAARTARQQRFDAGDRAVPPALAVARVRSVPDDSRLQADRLIPVARMERGGIREHQSGIALRSMRATSTSSDGDHCCAEPPS